MKEPVHSVEELRIMLIIWVIYAFLKDPSGIVADNEWGMGRRDFGGWETR